MLNNKEIERIYNNINNKRKLVGEESTMSKAEKEKVVLDYIKDLQNAYVKKNNDYFKSPSYQQELNELKKYLDSLKQGVRDKESKYDTLYKVIAIYSSKYPDALKLIYIKQIVDINELNILLKPFMVTCINNLFIKRAYEAYQFANKYRKDLTILMIDNEEFKNDIKSFYDLIENNSNETEIKTASKNFIQKYKYYFNSSEYKKKEEWLTLFLQRNETGKKIVNNLNKMPMLIEICNSDMNNHEKIYQISKILSPIKIIKSIIPYAVTFYNNDFIKEAMKVYFFVKKHENEFDLVKKNASYLEKLENDKIRLNSIKDYAYFVLSHYIEDDSILQINDYLKLLDIDVTLFNDCVEACSIFNYDLYNKFMDVKKQKESIIDKNNIMIVRDLINGIKTGYLSDGTELTLLEFLIRIPLRHEINCIPEDFATYYGKYLRQFMDEDEVSVISHYLITNKINNLSLKSIDTINDYTYHSIGNFVVTKEIHDYIIKYMQYNNYPLIRGIYNTLLNKYINNELEVTNEIKNNKIKVKVILVP